jgi:hypothetical protein
MICKLFHKIERKWRLPNTSYEDSTILIPKLAKDTTKKNTIGQFLSWT